MGIKDKIIVANTADSTLSIIDLKNNTRLSDVHLEEGFGPYCLALDNIYNRIIVTGLYDDSIIFIDKKSFNIMGKAYVGCSPSSIALDNIGLAYVCNADSDCISIIDMKNMRTIGQIEAGYMPQSIDYNIYKNILAVANTNSNDVWIMDGHKYNVIKKIDAYHYPCKVKFSKDGNYLYIGCFFSHCDNIGCITLIDLKTFDIDSKIETGGLACEILQMEDDSSVLSISTEKNRLEIIDILNERMTSTILTGNLPRGIAVNYECMYAYITNSGDDTVSIVDLANGVRVTDIKVGREPNGIIFLSC
ncbi:YncE family protein [Xylanivirga thermophila]|uniref:YncE family protein n=1 Tax=Xylanivirga thermophila TaxID=2496273 RepID=UPI00101B6300|nr:YncE family protein [Xylanivirga thermophila]